MYAKVWFCGFMSRHKKYDNEKLYTYKIPSKMKIKKGDFALVYVQQQCMLQVVKVIEITETTDISEQSLVCLVSKLDFKPLEAYVDVKKRKEILEKAIDAAYKKASKMQILQQIAKTDKDLQKLLDEYNTLEKD